ncbi:helix-turn-helix transcriptional regulator [Microbacterium sp. CFBP9034]|uniref:helix-turn-helix transcriptional regulator n=1 Tax=Microbacterium sp. CFBP9034 TaxID=3096540 RepID=UPI002A6B80EA|nr:AAA family ATPase [Microbacterium sp. CFBP9034]MDY0910496.1 AAA family ATPase [Microbacterium sp. CFBP9034]
MPALTSTPRMVGRRAELDVLLDAYDDGRAGHPRTVIVRGEAGIGKTRLVQEFLAATATRRDPGLPLVIAVGQCVDLGPIGSPFGPVRRVLRDLHSALGTDALRVAAGSPAVTATLAALVPGIADDAAAAEERPGEFSEAIEVLLEGLSNERHVIVVLEDLQWADAATLALLKTLASTLRGRHLTIVATYRSDDIDRFHPLKPVLAELDRTRTILRVEVVRLTLEEVAEQVAQLAAADGPTGGDVDALAERSGGIPFLVEELVDLGARGLPDTLRELVLARYWRLSEEAQETVRAMAAGGVHADHDVLVAVSALDEHALDVALREAIDSRVVLADGAGYSFRHALTREAVQGEMLPSERVRVHRRYAECLAERRTDSPDDVSAIAEHWLAARDLTAAFDATVVALTRSRAGYSPATSAKLAERLTELWDQVPDAETRAGATLAQLHLEAAQAWHDLGEAERALRSAGEGLAVCPDDPLTRAGLLRQRFVEVYNLEHHSRLEDLHTAVELLESVDDVRARVLLSRVLSNLAIGEHGAEAEEHAHRAISLAEEADDHAALAVALTIETWRIAGDEDDSPRAVAPIERAVALDLDPAMRAYAGWAQIDLLIRLGRFDEAALVGEQHYAECVRAGIERGSGSSIAFSVARALFAAGRPVEARRYARRALRLMERDSRGSALRMLSTHYTWNDEAVAREELLAAERTTIDETLRANPDKHGSWVIDRGDALLDRPGAAIAPANRQTWADTVDRTVSLAEDTSPSGIARFAALTAAMLLAAGSPDDARPARDRLEKAVAAWPARGTAPVVAAYVRAVLAEADRVAAPDRVALWSTVTDDPAFAELPVWHRHAARCFQAAALIEGGDRDAAAALLREVADEAPRHGVARVGRWATELAAQAGLLTDAGAPPRDAELSALTPRELQVLELIAEGLTNPQIGKRLFISPKTASVHVSAILAKIGASNRAEAAALYAASVA